MIPPHPDRSNGYERISSTFIATRSRAGIGTSMVAEWSSLLPTGASVLDLGCGAGVPISQTLIERGFNVYGVDASPSMIAAFHARFPNVPLECSPVEEADFFGRTFDAVIAWGLLFLLAPEVQLKLIHKVAAVLPARGRFLFTAPTQTCSWTDAMTGLPSVSLGEETYRSAIAAAGMQVDATDSDEGGNHYYSAVRLP